MPKQDVVLKLNTIGELFNAPDVNPFSENAIDVLGEAALLHAVRQMLARRIRNWHEARLVIQLPPDQITPDLQAQTQAAVQRYCTAKIEDNRLTIHLSRVRSAIGLAVVALISVAVIGAAWLLFQTIFAAQADTTVSALVAACISVFVWVILWDPMEKLIFDWVSPALENRILRGKGQAVDFIIPGVSVPAKYPGQRNGLKPGVSGGILILSTLISVGCGTGERLFRKVIAKECSD